MPLDRIGESLEATFQGVNQLVNGPELKQSLASLQATLAGAQDLMKRLDDGMAPSLRQLPAIADQPAGDADAGEPPAGLRSIAATATTRGSAATWSA